MFFSEFQLNVSKLRKIKSLYRLNYYHCCFHDDCYTLFSYAFLMRLLAVWCWFEKLMLQTFPVPILIYNRSWTHTTPPVGNTFWNVPRIKYCSLGTLLGLISTSFREQQRFGIIIFLIFVSLICEDDTYFRLECKSNKHGSHVGLQHTNVNTCFPCFPIFRIPQTSR